MKNRLTTTDDRQRRDGPAFRGDVSRWRWSLCLAIVCGVTVWASTEFPGFRTAQAAVETSVSGDAVVARNKLALVVGNAGSAAGGSAVAIRNARAMAAKLQVLGFKVDLAEDLTAAGMRRALDDFAGRADSSDIALFYFSGYELQAQKQKLLVPADAKIDARSGDTGQALSMQDVLRVLQRAGDRAAKMVVLDTAPYPQQERFRGLKLSNAPARPPSNFLVAESNGPVGDQGIKKDLSIFTAELIGELGARERSLEDVFRAVQVSVSEKTDGSQIPSHISTLPHDMRMLDSRGLSKAGNAGETAEETAIVKRGIRLSDQEAPQAKLDSRPGRGSETAQATDGSSDFEAALWNVIRESKNPSDFEAYLEVFPSGQYSTQARQRLSVLRPPETPKSAAPAVKVEAMQGEYELTVSANIRELPDTSSSIVGRGDKGERLQVTGRVVGANWYRVKTPGGGTAYVSSKLMREPPKAEPKPAAPKVAIVPPRFLSSMKTAPGGNFRDCPDCPEMVSLPAGSYRMGSDAGDPSERPAHTVRISHAFAVGKYEVTVAQWNSCVAAGGCTYKPRIKGAPEEAPVHKLSWKDVQEYLAWLKKVTGKPYRLLSEAEWEYAARGGMNHRFWWGDRMTVGMADCKDCGNGWSYNFPAPVGMFKPNPFGLYGMNGGVWEWTDDCWHTNYNHAPTDGSAAKDGDCGARVLRGGSWRNDAGYAHAASRLRYDFNVRYSTNGFRVARDLP